MGPATDYPRLLSWLRMLYITTSTSTSKVHVLSGVALLKLTLKFVCKIFTKYRVNTQPKHPHTRAARFYAIIASPNARRAFYTRLSRPARTRTNPHKKRDYRVCMCSPSRFLQKSCDYIHEAGPPKRARTFTVNKHDPQTASYLAAIAGKAVRN